MSSSTPSRRSFEVALAAPGFDDPGEPTPWGAAFRIDDATGAPIPLRQTTSKDFELDGTLEFVGEMGLDPERFPGIDDDMKRAARRVSGTELGASDLASVPVFLRWFVGPYGRHTPAALIHDHLIEGNVPNGGTLKNDVASDRYFRFMLQSVGVPFVKRWIMWAATAMRSRWAVGGYRRATVVAWALLALAGITTAIASTVALMTGGDLPADADEGTLLLAALVLALVASALWGRQWGAGLVAATAAPWLLPPVVIAVAGYLVYWAIERVLRLLGVT